MDRAPAYLCFSDGAGMRGLDGERKCCVEEECR
jgi:hypothetical protein